MGREIRMVPMGWEHPKDAKGNYKPMYDRVYAEHRQEWLDNQRAWDDGTHPSLIESPGLKEDYPFFSDWDGGPPDREYYRDAWTEAANCFQMYETVSEGTPVTPVFETEDELVDYLVEVGTLWGKKHNRKSAEAFVKAGYAPSFLMFSNSDGQGQVVDGVTAAGMDIYK